MWLSFGQLARDDTLEQSTKAFHRTHSISLQRDSGSRIEVRCCVFIQVNLAGMNCAKIQMVDRFHAKESSVLY